MRVLFFVFCLVVLQINSSCGHIEANLHRTKRSNETEVSAFRKVKDGFKAFGSKVSNVATQGYEEIKNLFSKDRKVGDYQLGNIDVRMREEDDYEEVNVSKIKSKVKREVSPRESEIDPEEFKNSSEGESLTITSKYDDEWTQNQGPGYSKRALQIFVFGSTLPPPPPPLSPSPASRWPCT